jgi:NADH-quinone oxidoreductase subunit L
MHGTEQETDLQRLGGLWRRMPWTAATMLAGALSLAGVFGLAGFFAKDEILAVASGTGRGVVWALGTLGAFCSALYIGRFASLALLGRPRSDRARHAHESPAVMVLPLVVLAAGALGLGVLMSDARTGALPSFLAPVLGEVPHGHAGPSEGALVLISQVTALGGLALAWYLYASGRVDWLALRERLASVQRLLARGMYVDDLYAAAVDRPVRAAAAALAWVVDARFVDGLVNGVGRSTQALAAVGRRVQTGFVRTYALAILLGAAALLIYAGVRW